MSYEVSKYPVEKLDPNAEIQPGFAFKSERFTDDPGDIPLVKGENVHQGYIDWIGAKHWPADEYDSFAKYHLVPGDVVLAMDRPWVTAGLKWSYIKAHDPKSLLVQRVARLRAKKNLEQDYLRHVISSSYFANYLQPIVTGVNVPHISGKQIGAFPIPIPKPEIQRKIAAILTAYDDLIETNKRRIALLEKMAEELYREWFARMRFPGHQNTKFVKGLPAKWDTKRIRGIVVRKKFGKIYRSTDLAAEGAIIVIDQSRSEYLGFYDGKAEHEASSDTPILLFGDHSCKMVFMTRPFSLAENVIPFTPKTDMPAYFLFHLIKDLAKTTEYKRHWTDLVNREVLIPRPELQVKFSEIVRSNHLMTEKLVEVNRALTKTRDLLLPRLISGKLSVEDLDIQFPPSMQEEATEPKSVHA